MIDILTSENILEIADYFINLSASSFIKRFQPVAHYYQTDIKGSADSYRLALAIRLPRQQGLLAIQRYRYETLARKIMQIRPLLLIPS